MIASLSMYDWPPQSADWDQLWAGIRDALVAHNIPAPDALTRDGQLWNHWKNPDLVLGQTCGLPYQTKLHDKVALVGAFDHALPGAPPGHYYSNFVVHRDSDGTLMDFGDKTLAYNSSDSQSGWAAAHNTFADRGLSFAKSFATGAHRESARAVADERAEIAAIDAETWRLIELHMPEIAEKLRILSRTEPTPGLPLITALGMNAAVVADAVEEALTTTVPDVLDRLHIHGFVRTPAEAYLAIRTPMAISLTA